MSLRLSLVLFLILAGCAAMAPETQRQQVCLPLAAGLEYNVDRPGSDYRNFDLREARPELCQWACAAEAGCVAFTYVKPGVQGPAARCWLKSRVPTAVSSGCCVSGVNR